MRRAVAITGRRSTMMGILMSQEKTDLPGDQQSETVFDKAEAENRAQDTADEGLADEHVQDAGTVAAAIDDPEVLQEALQQAREQADQYRDQALRAAAETPNIRKRAHR